MRKNSIVLLALFSFVLSSAFAQSFGTVANDKPETETIVDERGFSVQVKIETNMFQMTYTNYSDAEERFRRTNSALIDNYPFGGFDLFGDTWVALGYNREWFGGKFSINNGGMGGIKAWVGFLNNRIKISAGTDVGYGYADSQGADAGLRIYDDHTRTNNDGKNDDDDEVVDSNVNPDNITQDKGILIEFDLAPIKIALAGGGNFNDLTKNMGALMAAYNPVTNIGSPLYGNTLQYGVNIGGNIGYRVKLNGAYIFQTSKDETKYEFRTLLNRIVPLSPNAEVSNHLFGMYASYYPFGDNTLGFTLGYAGAYTQYLEEFSVNSKTAMPTVLKNGFNFTARYTTGTFTIKTDHNYSFWADKNYKIFYLYKPDAQRMKDYGLLALSNDSSDVSEVKHSFLWNGIGTSYLFTPVFEGSVYTRNLIRIDETPEYKMTIDYYSLEFKATFHLSPGVDTYAGLTYQCTGRWVSKSLPDILGEFVNGTPKATTDSVNMFRIPIGFIVKL